MYLRTVSSSRVENLERWRSAAFPSDLPLPSPDAMNHNARFSAGVYICAEPAASCMIKALRLPPRWFLSDDLMVPVHTTLMGTGRLPLAQAESSLTICRAMHGFDSCGQVLSTPWRHRSCRTSAIPGRVDTSYACPESVPMPTSMHGVRRNTRAAT